MQYTAYGLDILSEIALPELTSHSFEKPNVRISLGGVPDRLEMPLAKRVTWTASPGEWLHEVNGVGRYYVRGGCDVRIEPIGTESDVRAFLFASTLGALLHQRGLLVLHASAVYTPAGAVVFSGASGAGKSTLLATLLQRGYPMLADDKVAITSEAGRLSVLPGYATLRLWSDAIEKLGLSSEGRPSLRKGLEKYLYGSPHFHAHPARLRAIYMLDIHKERGVRVEALDDLKAFSRLRRNIYRRKIVDGLGQVSACFTQIAALVSDIPVVCLYRPEGGNSIEAVADALDAHFRHFEQPT